MNKEMTPKEKQDMEHKEGRPSFFLLPASLPKKFFGEKFFRKTFFKKRRTRACAPAVLSCVS